MPNSSTFVHRLRHRALILVLSLTLVVTLLPTAAFAAPANSLANPAYVTGRMQPRHQPDRRPDHSKRCSTTYRVRKGDNLTRIARHFGVSVKSLVRSNNVRNPNRILAGQVLCIP
jgi:nucleoid-associated protein YgaU